MELEEKATVAGASKLKADEELAKVCPIHNNQLALLVWSLVATTYMSAY